MRNRSDHILACLVRLTVTIAVLLFVFPGAKLQAQDKTGRTIRFSKKQLAISPYEGSAIADINLDGQLDIISSPNIYYGPDFVPQAFRSNHLSNDYIRANSDHVYDVDRDGWPDIIIGAWGTEGLVWYKNPENSVVERGTPWEMHQGWKTDTLTKTKGRMEMFAMHDYDGDGVPEFHSVSYIIQEPLEIWRFTKNSDGNPKLDPFILGMEGGGHGFAFGDVNGDGREDVLCEIGWYERPEGDPFAGPWKLHPETDLRKFHPSCPFAVKDLNGDGRLDIIFGRAHDYGLYWWEQLEPEKDGTTRWKHHVIDESWSQVHVLTLADLDNDGNEELIAGKCIWAHNGKDPGWDDPAVVYYYKWDKSRNEFIRHTIAGPGENIALGRQISTADLNGDGRIDIVLPAENGLWVLFNEGY